MKFTPKTAAEIAASSLLPDGDYPLTIVTASDAPSKSSGKAMLTLNILVYPPGGGAARKITDYIVPGTAYADKKLFQLCHAVGLAQEYQAGDTPAFVFEGKECWAKIGSQKGQEKKDGSGSFDPKNCVRWYNAASPTVTALSSPAKPQPTDRQLANLPPAGAADDDQVPF